MSTDQSLQTVIPAPPGFYVVTNDGHARLCKLPVVAFAISDGIARPISARAHAGTALLTSGGDVVNDAGQVLRNIDEWLESWRSPCR